MINADTALHLPDFRAAERTFQLVTQVAGRTGRGDEGRPRAGADASVPSTPAIQAARAHDYRLLRRARSCRSGENTAIRRSRRWSGWWCAGRGATTAAEFAEHVRRAADAGRARRSSPACSARPSANRQNARAVTASTCWLLGRRRRRVAGHRRGTPRPISSRPRACSGSSTSIRSTCCSPLATTHSRRGRQGDHQADGQQHQVLRGSGIPQNRSTRFDCLCQERCTRS